MQRLPQRLRKKKMMTSQGRRRIIPVTLHSDNGHNHNRKTNHNIEIKPL
jgi:hypothetical protein